MVRHRDVFVESLVQPVVVVPSQFFTSLRRQAPSRTGECQLLAAVLEDAIDCFQKYLFAKKPGERRLFREAEEWMMTTTENQKAVPPSEQEKPAFSFQYICEVLGLDPNYLRQGLQRWRESQSEQERELTRAKARRRSLHTLPVERLAADSAPPARSPLP